MRDCCEQLEIDTKDTCLLCLEPKIDNGCVDSLPSLRSLKGLQQLLRYLKVSPKELFNCSSEFLQSMEIREDIDLKITLCSKCSSVTEKFNQLYQDYELIQVQFNDCVHSMHQSISRGNENPERVREYKDQMRPNNSADLVNASIAANLRTETLKKCSMKLEKVTQQVRVASEMANLTNCLKYTKAVDVGCSSSVGVTTQIFEHHVPLPRETGSLPMKVKFGQVPEPDGGCGLLRNRASEFPQKSTEAIPDKEAVPVEPVKKSMKRTLPTASRDVSNRARDETNISTCEYCKLECRGHDTLRRHLANSHSEHLISEYLPESISWNVRKQSADAVWEDIFEMSTTQCQFCKKEICEKRSVKRHVMYFHAKKFAVKVIEKIRSLPESKKKQQGLPTDPNIDGIVLNTLLPAKCQFRKTITMMQNKPSGITS